jgi:dephospho-CoA kinase
MPRVLTIGLTGGIGSGKTAVSRMLAARGAHVIDADRVGHEIYSPGKPAWNDLVGEFGDEIVAADGTIDRKRLGARVFSDRAALDRLNAILHPRMADEIRERIVRRRADGERAPIVVEAAVLIEAGWDRLVDEVWLVTAPAGQAVARVVGDRGLPTAEVERRISSQISDEARARRAQVRIDNSGTLGDLEREVDRLWAERVASAHV